MAAALRAVEFYSGIGGMHYALNSCGVDVKVVAAIDINTTANEVYAHNFSDTVLLNRNIEGIKLEEFMKFNADIFTMSPPCQPFTRQGNQKASEDPRTKSFLHIMKVIRSLPKPPSYVLMENVKGFEVSETREEFIRTLNETNYVFQEFLLSPAQFGVSNSRLRYFLVGVRKPLQLPFARNDSTTEYNQGERASFVEGGKLEGISGRKPSKHRKNQPAQLYSHEFSSTFKCRKYSRFIQVLFYNLKDEWAIFGDRERQKAEVPGRKPSKNRKLVGIMNCLPATLSLNIHSEPCSRLNADNPREHCPVCNKQATELHWNKPTNNTDSSAEQEAKLRHTTECEELTEGNACSNLEDICTTERKQNRTKCSDKHTANYSSSNSSKPNSTEKQRNSKTDSHHEECFQNWENIQDYLGEDTENFKEFLVPDNILKKKVLLMDIVQKNCNHSCCFTKGYGHYVEGTGSVLQMTSVDSSLIFEKYGGANDEERISLLAPLGLRYFTPREIANILCFPKQFDFPKTVTTKQKYRLLGNSLNILVVRELMKIMLTSVDQL